MALSQDRIIAVGHTTHPHEREAYEFAVRELPDTDPYRLWAFVDLIAPSGCRYDLDLLVLAYHAIYLVEIKSYPGTVTGDGVDWQVSYPGGERELKENPLRTTNLKAKVLATLLTKQFDRDPAHRNLRRPWGQPLVFLAHQDVDPKLTPAGATHVVTRQTFRDALAFGKFPGAPRTFAATGSTGPSGWPRTGRCWPWAFGRAWPRSRSKGSSCAICWPTARTTRTTSAGTRASRTSAGDDRGANQPKRGRT